MGTDLLLISGIDAPFFEGTFRGYGEFEVIAPPESAKAELLNRAKAAILDPPHPTSNNKSARPPAEYTRIFLQAYHAAPREVEQLLLAHRGGLDMNRLRLAYTYLEMFDTPEAVAAVEAINKWYVRDNLLGWFLGLKPYPGRGLESYIYFWMFLRRLAIVSLIGTAIVVFLFRKRIFATIKVRKDKIGKNVG